jgi:hypothetical protein
LCEGADLSSLLVSAAVSLLVAHLVSITILLLVYFLIAVAILVPAVRVVVA